MKFLSDQREIGHHISNALKDEMKWSIMCYDHLEEDARTFRVRVTKNDIFSEELILIEIDALARSQGLITLEMGKASIQYLLEAQNVQVVIDLCLERMKEAI